MKRIIILFLIFVSIIQQVDAQELTIPAQAQYLADNPFSITPTFAGIGDNVRIRVNGMAQWVGIKDAPINQSLLADFRIADRDGVGINLYNDKNGNTRQYGGKFSWAHHLILDTNSEQYLSLGLSANLNQFKIDIANFDTTISGTDPSVTNDRYNQNFNFDVGFLYRIKDVYFAFNASNILDKKISELSFNKVEPSTLRNYQVYSGVRIRQRNSKFELEPSVFFQYFQSDRRSTTDFNIKAKLHRFEDYYWVGVTTRFLNDQSLAPLTVGPMAGFRVRDFYFGYSYQITTNKLVGFNAGTHTFTLGFDFLQYLSDCPCTHERIVY
jgi:type IX secretion system PorP/SprF family membrane protein